MPSAAASHPSSTAELTALLHSLQHALQTNPSTAQKDLSTAKLALLHSNALIPSPQTPTHTLQTARSILETGALISIRLKDPPAFVRYWSQLQPFYDYATADYSPSKDRSKITGLYLLLLLSQGDYAAFHTVLEGLVAAEGEGSGSGNPNVVENDPFIRYPVELERSLMEGSYDQVWKGTMGEGVPGEEFALFSQVSSPVTIPCLCLLCHAPTAPRHPRQPQTPHAERSTLPFPLSKPPFTHLTPQLTPPPPRISSTQSAARSPHARNLPTHPSPSPAPRTSSSSTPKALSSSLRAKTAGASRTHASISPVWMRLLVRAKRVAAMWAPIRRRFRIWSAMRGSWR
jgi:CSN8/PSMD8/EIF3K family